MDKVKKYIFPALYTVGFVGMFIIGFFGNSYFAYDKFNSLWADILYVVFVSMLFITAFVQEIFHSRAVKDILVNFAVFILGLAFLLLHFFLGGAFTLCMLIYSAITATVIGFRYMLVLRKDPTVKPDSKRIIAVVVLFLFAIMALMRIAFVNSKLWLWALIPAAVLSPVAVVTVYLLLKKVWNAMFSTEAKRVFNAIALAFIILFVIYAYSASFIGIANTVFDGEPQRTEFTVIEKKVQSGARKPVRFEVKVVIDNKARWIPVSVTDYHEIEEGDSIVINYYSGAFKLAYYAYYGKV